MAIGASRRRPATDFEKLAGHGKVLVRDEPLASIIQEALDGFASGRLETQAEVKRYLESRPEFMSSKRQSELRYEEVMRLLTRPHYAGYIDIAEWGVSLRKGHHEGLITLEQYQKIQDRMREGARAPARKDLNEDFVLRGAVICADCNKPLTACWSKSKTGKQHPYYLCFSKGCESYRKSIPRDRIEGEFETLLQHMTPTREVFELVRAMFKLAWDTRLEQAVHAAVALKADIVRLDKQIDQLMDRIVEASSVSMITAYERRVEKLQREKLIAAEKLQQKPGPKRPFEEMFELACDFLSSPWNIWNAESLAGRRMVLRMVFSERPAYGRNSGFRTPKTTLPFKLLGDFRMGKCEMAERKGLSGSSGSTWLSAV